MASPAVPPDKAAGIQWSHVVVLSGFLPNARSASRRAESSEFKHRVAADGESSSTLRRSRAAKSKNPEAGSFGVFFNFDSNEKFKLKLDAFSLLERRRHLQARLGQGLDKGVFHVFGGGVSGGGEFTDEEEFGPFQHLLFPEGERLGAA